MGQLPTTYLTEGEIQKSLVRAEEEVRGSEEEEEYYYQTRRKWRG